MVNFNAAPNKKAKIVLETSAFKQSRSDLNVAFSTADRDTAILEFTVTQNNKPLLLGDNNIKSSIIFIHSNGMKIKAPLVITDGLNGKISYQVPNDILSVPGTVTAQVYVARKSTTDTQAVVAERIFSFTIQESLAWEFDAETKLNYIIEFDELEAELKQRAYAIEQAIANAEDYVGLIEQAKANGLSDIEVARANSIEELTTLANSKLTEIDTKGTQYVEDLTNVRDGIDNKINQFNTDVSSGGYTKDTATSNWQKYKLTNEDGSRMYIKKADFKHINDLPIGFHETVSGSDPVSQGLPSEIKDSYVEIDVMAGTLNTKRKQYRATKSFDNRTWVKTIHTDGAENEWKEITPSQTDTGWVSFAALNGAIANTAYSTDNGFNCSYKITTNGNVVKKSLRINVKNVIHNQVIGILPSNFAKNAQTHIVRTSLDTDGAFVVIRPNGEITVLLSGDRNKWYADAYLYGEVNWND